MSDHDIRSLILFFYLCFLNADKALDATGQSARILNQNFKFTRRSKTRELVSTMQKVFAQFENRVTDYTSSERDLRFSFPTKFQPRQWIKFLKETPSQEVQAYIWVHVLDLNLPEVAMALEVSEGTLRHRVGRALRSLGEAL